MEIKSAQGCWSLLLDGRELISHCAAEPFATAVRKEKQFSGKRGGVKVSEKIVELVPLTDLSAQGNTVTFSGKGCALTMTVAERPDGFTAAFEATEGYGYILRLSLGDGGAVFGGGEQYRKLNLQGERVKNLVSEHITLPTILQKALLPPSLYKEKPHSAIGSYSPMPIFVFEDKTLLLFDADCDGYTDLDGAQQTVSLDRCPSSMTVIRAKDYRALSLALAREIPNRQYIPDWCHQGMILGVQGGTKAVLEKAAALQDAGAAICGVWCQDWSGEKITAMGKQVYWNWEEDRTLYPELAQTIERLRQRGIRFLAYINPYLVKDGPLYNFCKDKGYLITHTDGSIYHIASTTFDAGMLDLTNPAAAEYIKESLIKKNMLSLGVCGYMADFGEYLPGDCVLHEGDPALLHNLWPVLWAKLNREAVEEYGDKDVFFFTRSGYRGISSYAPLMWNGDQHVDWSRDYGLPCVMPASFSLGFSGVTLTHSDVGGFFSFGRMKRSPELLVRWMELCAFSPLMRGHEGIKPWVNAQPDTPELIGHTAALSQVHKALAPYLSQVVNEASNGIPAIRPDFYDSGDHYGHRDEYAYFLGNDVFVAPVISGGAATRKVYLPEGQWLRFFTGEEYGAGEHTVSAPLGTPAAFYRAGSEFESLFKSIKL